jgi:hypothetical protein
MGVVDLRGFEIRRPYLLIWGAWLLNGAAWFLPVVKGVLGGGIDPITGWRAFILAAYAVPRAWGNLLATLSVVTTLFFIGGSLWAVFRGNPLFCRLSAWVATAAFLFNAHWYLRLSPNGWISNLGIGYFLWWWSFALLAIGLFDLAGENNAVASTRTALAPR